MTTLFDPIAKEDLVRKHFYNDIALYDRDVTENEYPNIYHCNLNLPFTIERHEMCQGSPAEAKITNLHDYRYPQIEELHNKLGIKTLIVEIVYTPPNSNLPIHSDFLPIDNHVKLNITWGDSEKAGTRWWLPKDRTTTFDTFPINNNREEYDLIYQAKTNSPCLINVGQLHDSYNPSDQGRWTLSHVLANSDGSLLQWDQAVEIYKDYII